MNKVLFVLALIAVVAFAKHMAVSPKMIREINKKQSLWKAAPNHMTKMSEERIHQFLDRTRKLPLHDHTIGASKHARSHLPHRRATKTYTRAERLAAPESFDARQQWPKCTPMQTIHTQTMAGAAWSLVAVEAMSDRMCVFKNENNLMLSVMDVDTCSDCDEMAYFRANCVWGYWVKTGIVSEECYPTSSTAQPGCPNKCTGNPSLVWDTDKHKGKNNYTISGEADMMTELSQNGPFQVAFEVYADFMSYTSGIYYHAAGGYQGAHTVKVIGYGTENGVKYWICANSWGTSWGENGFFRIRRGTNECGVENIGYAGIPL